MKLVDKVDTGINRVLVFGGPKSGKTQLCAELAEYFNILYFDLENGWSVFRKLPQEWKERVEIISIPDTKDYPIAIQTALKVITGQRVTICQEHGKVTCPICAKAGAPSDVVELNALDHTWIVVWDSLSQLANSAMSHITKDKDDDYKPDWGDFRVQGALMDKFLSRCQQAKFNLICITHEVEAELEDGRKKIVPVAGTREFSRNTAKYFDHVVYCQVKNKGHDFGSATTYGTSVLTGSRTDVSLENLAKASLLAIFKPELKLATKSAPMPPTKVVGAGKTVAEAEVAEDVPPVQTPTSSALAALKLKLSQGGK